MASLWEHRLVVVAPLTPAAQFAALRTWWAANVVEAGDGPDDPAAWPGLNAAGDTSAPTHRWWSAALKDSILKAILLKCCQLGGVAPPTNQQWAGWTRPQKIVWLNSVRAAVRAATGIHLDLCQQQGTWTNPQTVLAAVGLKRRTA